MVTLDSPTDYRMEKLNSQPVYLTPLDQRTDMAMDASWMQALHGRKAQPMEIPMKGRSIHVPLAVDRMAPLIGASGAICALMGAFLWMRPRFGLLSWRLHRRLVQGAILVFALLNVTMMLVPLKAESPLAEVGWGAHAGGLATGFLLGAMLILPRRGRSDGTPSRV